MSRKSKKIVVGALAGLIVYGVLSLLWIAFLPRIVARAVSPDGIEMCMVQKFNWSLELFTTSFVYRKPGVRWGWFYYDHQDQYWGKGAVSLDTNNRIAWFSRDGQPVAVFFWDKEKYVRYPCGSPRTAQDWKPKGWTPRWSR